MRARKKKRKWKEVTRNDTVPTMHLSMRTRMTENDGVGRHRKCAYARTISRDGPGPDGCCARVRINLRLLVKTRALSFHLCAGWFARLASSNVCVSGPRLRLCWCWDIYMRCRRGRRSGTPVDFLPRERGKKREQPSALSRVLFILERKKETPCATQSVPFLPSLDTFGNTCYISQDER